MGGLYATWGCSLHHFMVPAWRRGWRGVALIVPAAISVLLLLVFSVGIPQGLSEYAGEAVLARSLPVLAFMWVVFWSVAQVVRGIKSFVRLLGRTEETSAEETEAWSRRSWKRFPRRGLRRG